jgi:hypothetical protein
MILDNKNTNLKVHEWIAKYTKEGKFSLVTGYFTIGAIAYLVSVFPGVARWNPRCSALDRILYVNDTSGLSRIRKSS